MRSVRPLTAEETVVFNHYYKEYYEMILGIARSRVGDENLAEVVAQEAFVTAWERFDDFQKSENPPGWLVIVAKNKSKEAIRDRKRYMDHMLFGRDVEEMPVEYNYDNMEPIIPESEEKQLLKRFYEEGYSLQELADEQNIKLSTMKMRVKRAREKLKEKILQKQ